VVSNAAVITSTESGQPGGKRLYRLDPEPDYRRIRPARLLVLGLAVVLVLWIVFLAIRAFEHVLAGGLDAVALGGTILTVGVGGTVWGVLGLGPGAESCQLAADGFTLAYKSGRRTTLAWTDPRLRITLFELLYKGRLTYSVATRWPFLNPIPRELYVAILAEARARGFNVTEHTDTLASGHQLKIRIQAAKQPFRA